MTDFGPYLLTVVIGVPLLKHCGTRARPLLLGGATVVALAPFYNIPGDYYEMGSILATRVAVLVSGEADWTNLRSDDLFKLIEELETLSVPGTLSTAYLVIVAGTLVAVLLAFLTYAAGSGFAALLSRLRS